jgi:hypothetical protein
VGGREKKYYIIKYEAKPRRVKSEGGRRTGKGAGRRCRRTMGEGGSGRKRN